MRVLCDYGLVEVGKPLEENEAEQRGYGMHSCVHSWTIYVINQEWDAELAGLALDCVGRHVPNQNVQYFWVTQRRLLQHASRCWGYVVDGKLDGNGREWILHNFGHMFQAWDGLTRRRRCTSERYRAMRKR